MIDMKNKMATVLQYPLIELMSSGKKLYNWLPFSDLGAGVEDKAVTLRQLFHSVSCVLGLRKAGKFLELFLILDTCRHVVLK